MRLLSSIERKTPKINSEYLYDESRLKGADVKNIWLPENEDQIATILLHCNEKKIPVTVYGKGTGITGAAVAFEGDVISMERFDSISGLGFDEIDRPYIRVQANVELAEINDILLKKDFAGLTELSEGVLKRFYKEDPFFYPVDPTEMGASAGGTVATNASGARSFKFGPTRRWVRSLKIVFADGSIETIKRGIYRADSDGVIEFKNKKIKIPDYKMPECKNAAGYFTEMNLDLIDLFIGSEGTLGLIVEAELWLEKMLPKMSVIQFFKEQKTAFDYVAALKNSERLSPDFIEYIDGNGLSMIRGKNIVNIPEISKKWNGAIFFDVDHNDIEDVCDEVEKICISTGADVNETWCAWEKMEIERVRLFRHALPETVNLHIATVQAKYPTVHKLGTDFSVCDEKFGEMMDYSLKLIEKNKLNYAVFGHIGDNHLHINMLPNNDSELKKGKEIYAALAQKAVDLGGTVSAEHGIGKIKHRYIEIMYGKQGISEMRRVKKIFDPNQILNRDNIFKYEE